MIVNCINLPHRTDRKQSAIRQSIEQGFEIFFWEGVYEKTLPPYTCISQSHKKIVQYAKENGLPYSITLEDDAIFTDKDSWKYFNENTPSYFDMYIASYYSGLETYDHRIESFRGMTLIKIANKFFDTFLSLPEDKNIDNALDYQGEYFVSPLMCCLQMPGYSDQMKKEVDYTNKIPEHKIFRGYATIST